MKSQNSREELQKIPGVGESLSKDLYSLGIRSIGDLKNKSPEDLFEALCKRQGRKIDRCVLYTFRCAVYYASDKSHEPEKLKWWNWKDDPTLVHP
mgnify:CR=1 FL=1